MRRWRRSAWAACGAAVALLAGPASPWAAPPCDEFDPNGPMRRAQITLDAGALVDETGEEMRSFIDTGSLGRVDVAVVAATPPGVVRGYSAVPEISRFSPHYGEQLKGIAVAVRLRPGGRAPRIVLELRQVCAEHFRNTFLYY